MTVQSSAPNANKVLSSFVGTLPHNFGLEDLNKGFQRFLDDPNSLFNLNPASRPALENYIDQQRQRFVKQQGCQLNKPLGVALGGIFTLVGSQFISHANGIIQHKLEANESVTLLDRVYQGAAIAGTTAAAILTAAYAFGAFKISFGGLPGR